MAVTVLSCDTGKLELVASLNNSLDESSGLAIVKGSNLIWTIEDSGNNNSIYGVNLGGSIVQEIKISNARNVDWEDLATDDKGNIYIGDFGNNYLGRRQFIIYKIANKSLTKTETTAKSITFKLPNNMKSQDFESFFLMNDHFYVFSKEAKNFKVFKVPNKIGFHTAKLVSTYNLEGKNNSITSATISPDKKMVLLLNHDKLWQITDFKNDRFFEGTISLCPFEHNSQKEGICFFGNKIVYISDERKGVHGGNIYKLGLGD